MEMNMSSTFPVLNGTIAGLLCDKVPEPSEPKEPVNWSLEMYHDRVAGQQRFVHQPKKPEEPEEPEEPEDNGDISVEISVESEHSDEHSDPASDSASDSDDDFDEQPDEQLDEQPDEPQLLGKKRAREPEPEPELQQQANPFAAINIPGIDFTKLTPQQLALLKAAVAPEHSESNGVVSNTSSKRGKYTRPNKIKVINNNFVRADKYVKQLKKKGNNLLPVATTKWVPKWAENNLTKIKEYYVQIAQKNLPKGEDFTEEDIKNIKQKIKPHKRCKKQITEHLKQYEQALQQLNHARQDMAQSILNWKLLCNNL